MHRAKILTVKPQYVDESTMFARATKHFEMNNSRESISIRNRCGCSINLARRLERLTPNNRGSLVDFARDGSRLYVEDWLDSENFKVDSPRGDM
jgi:hypothetical protein